MRERQGVAKEAAAATPAGPAATVEPTAYGPDVLMRLQAAAGNQATTALIQRKENVTGLPGSLRSGLESQSGMDLSGVKVHYNSEQPKALQAKAYAEGTDIHVAPGQESHLPHEAWHVVQQMQGRVQPTMQL